MAKEIEEKEEKRWYRITASGENTTQITKELNKKEYKLLARVFTRLNKQHVFSLHD